MIGFRSLGMTRPIGFENEAADFDVPVAAGYFI